MKVNDVRAKDASALKKDLLELYREQFNLRMQQATGQLGNSARFKTVRRDIARIKTVLNEQKQEQA